VLAYLVQRIGVIETHWVKALDDSTSTIVERPRLLRDKYRLLRGASSTLDERIQRARATTPTSELYAPGAPVDAVVGCSQYAGGPETPYPCPPETRLRPVPSPALAASSKTHVLCDELEARPAQTCCVSSSTCSSQPPRQRSRSGFRGLT
jgi:hypothetical protein